MNIVCTKLKEVEYEVGITLAEGHLHDRGECWMDGCRYTLDVDGYLNGERRLGMIEIHGDSKGILEAIVNKIVKDFS